MQLPLVLSELPSDVLQRQHGWQRSARCQTSSCNIHNTLLLAVAAATEYRLFWELEIPQLAAADEKVTWLETSWLAAKGKNEMKWDENQKKMGSEGLQETLKSAGGGRPLRVRGSGQGNAGSKTKERSICWED